VLGHYGYGFEKSYSRRALRGMLERAGLRVSGESGILFMPGWLRMADLAAHTRFRPAAPVTRALVRFFAALDRRFPRLRAHGYLLASTGTRPRERGGAGVFATPDFGGQAALRARVQRRPPSSPDRIRK